MPLFRNGGLTVGGTTLLRGTLTALGAMILGDDFKAWERSHTIPNDATYIQPSTPIYDIYIVSDTNTAAIFRAGLGAPLQDHLYFVVNLSDSIVGIQSSGGDPLGGLPPHSTAILINSLVLLIATNAFPPE